MPVGTLGRNRRSQAGQRRPRGIALRHHRWSPIPLAAQRGWGGVEPPARRGLTTLMVGT